MLVITLLPIIIILDCLWLLCAPLLDKIIAPRDDSWD